MAPRYGFTWRALQDLDATVCATDARVLFKDDGDSNVIIRTHDGRWHEFSLSGPRELRLLGKQLIARADHIERGCQPFEEVEL